ncbi:HlyD family efflux transporter periplasmic adaptor subunit [Rubripirellula reticaptiva]|nr:HlyD family efflux transporter periplasmic adaptor subunit [Rubripirellula reticaptiva]
MLSKTCLALLVSFCWSGMSLADKPDVKSASDLPVKTESKTEPKAETKTAPVSEEKKAEPKTVDVNGVFEAVVQAEIAADTEHVTSWEIKKLVEHGSLVTQGQNVVVFETEDVDEQVKKSETDLRLAKIALDDAEFEFQQFVETQKLDRAAAELARKNARQGYDNFVQVDRDRDVLSAEFNLKSSRASLENAQEELEQLQQMYLEDDLTEESEEIVLKRAKQAVEFAQFRLDGTKISSERSMQQGVPNSTAKQEESIAKAELAYKKSMHDLNSARQRREIEMQTKRDDFTKQAEKTAELKHERKQSAIASPIDGIVLYGELNRGQLGDKPSTLKTGSKVTPNQVIATIANPKKLQIHATVDQGKLDVVTEGSRCEVTCDAFPDFKANGTVKSVATVGYASGKFDCVVTFKTPKNSPAIMPTMTCKLTFADIAKEAAKETNDE